MTTRARLVTVISALMSTVALGADPAPSPRQLAWHSLKAYAFIHFSVNTFTDKEWGYGDEPPAVFDPTDFDADQIVTTLKDAGLTGIVLTCKHHDGFCLWPSKYTDHCVAHCPWKHGRGDVVREISDACKKHGLKFGVYLSPWDRHHADYGSPAYLTYYRNQLHELLTDYGPIFEVWFDGANGGDGYYGGAKQNRKIDNRTYYDWPNTIAIVRELQPDACIFSDAGPDVRWVGNESGVAGQPCWQTVDPAETWPGHADPKNLNHGDRDGPAWIPPEVDVSIRPGWFYHRAEDAKVKSPDQLFDIYLTSVGRGANLILNVPPDRRGRINDADVKSLLGWRKKMDGVFGHDLAASASFSADAPGDPRSPDGVELKTTTPTIELTWPQPVTFDLVRIAEAVRLGQRVDAIEFDVWTNGGWTPFAKGQSVGPCLIVKGSSVSTTKLRLHVPMSRGAPVLCGLGVFSSSARS